MVVVDAKWLTPKTRRPGPTGYLAAAGALLLCVAQVSSAHGDSASCIAKVSSYVAEPDTLLSKERNLLTPYIDLNERYFPFRDCEADALLEVVSRSRFIQPIDYNPGLKEYFIVLARCNSRLHVPGVREKIATRFYQMGP
jgi:hypothetical protein